MKEIFLSIIIPAYNEEKRLPETLRSIAQYLASYKHGVEVIVVDDGSSDETAQSANALQNEFDHLIVIRNEENHGKGYAVKTGMMRAQGKYALFMDADNATRIEEIEKFEPYLETHPVIIGSRHLKTSNIVIKQPWYRVLISRAGNLLIQATIVRGVIDTQCGFKLFSREAYTKIFPLQKIDRWGFDMELLAIAQRIFRFKIKEVPVSWYNSADSRLRPIRDAWRTLRELMRIKWNLVRGLYRQQRKALSL